MSSVIIVGSARKDGNTKKICNYIHEIADAYIYDLNDFNIAYYSYDHNNKEDDFLSLIEKTLEYDTIIFATPVYWYSMSAQLKTFLDRFTDLLKIRKDLGRQLKGKNMQVICCSSDEEEYPEFWKPFQRTASYLDMQYLGHAHTWIEEDTLPIEVKNRLNILFGLGK